MFDFCFELDMARPFHLVSVIFMILVISQVLAKRSRHWERVREKVGERREENERREEGRENPTGSVGWRRKRSLHGTLTYFDIYIF